MIVSRYKIVLPADYDMEIIRKRVRDNGHKTDGFEGLAWKLYLISEKGQYGNFQNAYGPLYLWRQTEGLNRFLFEGFFDNIIGSFGRPTVEVEIPLTLPATEKVKEARFVFETEGDIPPSAGLNGFRTEIRKRLPEIEAEYLLVCDPENWRYRVFYFLDDARRAKGERGTLYSVLHVSL